MKSQLTKFVLAFIFSLAAFTSYCQDIQPSKLLGRWVFNKLVFLSPMPDSLKMIRESEGGTVTFIEGNKFISKHKADGIEKEESGTYSIEGKYMDQGGERCEIITLNDKEFIVTIEGIMTIYFLRMKDPG